MKRCFKIFLLFLLLLAISFAVRYFYSKNVANLDEGTYLATGMLISKGRILYTEIYESKPPIFHLINALTYLIFGPNIFVNRFLITLTAVATGFIAYIVTREVTNNEMVAISSWLIFVFFSSLPSFESFYVMTEPYQAIMVAISFMFFVKSVLSNSNWKGYNALSGFCLGTSLLIRPTSAILIPILVISIVSYCVKSKNSSLRKRILEFTLAVVVPFLAVSLFLFLNGALYPFLIKYYPLLFRPGTGVIIAPEDKVLRFLTFLREAFPLLFFSIVCILGCKIGKKFVILPLALYPYTFLLVVYYAKGLAAWGHHFYETLFPLSVLSALGIEIFGTWVKSLFVKKNVSRSTILQTSVAPAIFLIFILIFSLGTNLSRIERLSSFNDINIIDETSEYIKGVTEPGECIFVFDTRHPKISSYIYYKSEREPPNPHLWFFKPIILSKAMEVIDSVESRKIRYVVLIGDKPESYTGEGWIYAYIFSNYKIERVITETYRPYPWSKEQPIAILKRVEKSSQMLHNFETLDNISKSWSHPLDSVTLSLSSESIQGNSSVKIEYSFEGDNEWATVKITLPEILDATQLNCPALSVWVYGDGSKNEFYLEIMDENGNRNRYCTLLNFEGWSKISVPLNNMFFIRAPWKEQDLDFSRINRILISIGATKEKVGYIYIDELAIEA